MWKYTNTDELYHFGIDGMKWGARRWQNEDGSLTPAGYVHYYGHARPKGETGPAYAPGHRATVRDGVKAANSDRKESVKDSKEKGLTVRKANSEARKAASNAVKDAKNEDLSKSVSKESIDAYRKKMIEKYAKDDLSKASKYQNLSDEAIAAEIQRRDTTKKVLIATAATVGVGAAIYLAYRSNVLKHYKDIAKTTTDAKPEAILTKAMAQAADDMDYVFKEGSEFHRMVGAKDFDLKKELGKLTYVTTTEGDRAAYAAFLKDWTGTGERYDVTLKTLKDVIAPSDTKAKEIFEKLWNDNPEYSKMLRNTLINTYQNQFGLDYDMAKMKADEMIKDNKFKAGIYSFVKQQGDSKLLMEAYKNSGYSAVIDYFDKGSLGEKPLIMFDAANDLVKSGEEFVTPQRKRELVRQLATISSHPLSKDAKRMLSMLHLYFPD